MTIQDQLTNINGIGKKRATKIEAKMREEKLSLADVFAMSSENIKKIFGLPINVAKAITDTAKHSSTQVVDDETSNSEPNIITLHKDDETYPQRLIKVLGDNAPENLYVWGNLDLLNKPAVGFCGSRNVTDKGLNITADVTKQIAALDWVAVSGHARGVDATAHRVALENNAGTIIVLPEGLDNFKLRPELKKIAKKENLLVISEFPLDAGWAVGRAMQRNRTIIGLSNAMVLVESRDKGGTFDAGKKALKYNHPLFVVDFQEMENSNAGNQYFIQRGAERLLKSRETGRANITFLQSKVEQHLIHAQLAAKKQLELFEAK